VDVAAYLVVLDKDLHPEQVEATIAATLQLKGVVGIRTLYDDIGREISGVRKIREEARSEIPQRVRQAGL
jgi:hypothetical protein